MIQGVIYDLDGTMINTVPLHEAAWQAAAESIGVRLSEETLAKQKGMTNEEAVTFLFPDKTEEEKENLVQKKSEYIMEHPSRMQEAEGMSDTVAQLHAHGCTVWICTAGTKSFVSHVASVVPLVDRLKGKIVWREMYREGKPAPEPILITLREMGVPAREAIFVGDAWNDYEAAKDADVLFLYFCPEGKLPDPAIPPDVPRLQKHSEILKYIKEDGE